MLPHSVGDHVSFKGCDSSPWDDNNWMVVHIAGSKLMLKQGHLVICGVHADEIALQGSRMKGCNPMRGPARNKPRPAKPQFFQSIPKRAESISDQN